MNRFTRLFLIYILATLSVLSVYSTSNALSLINMGSGVADRVRKYGDFDFKYVEENKDDNKQYYEVGFQCKPDMIRSNGEGLSNEEDANKLLNSLKQVSVDATFDIADALIVPLICPVILKVYSKVGLDGTVLITTLVSFLGASFKNLIEEFFVQTDFNLDPLNDMCLPITIPMVTSCVAFAIASKVKNTTLVIGAYAAAVLVYGVAKTIHANIQLNKAKAVFHNLKMCGDSWYTYGNEELMKSSCINSVDMKIKSDCIRKNYPVKGVFPGAYKYYLNKCVNERGDDGLVACKRLGATNIVESSGSDLRYELSENNRVLREYNYGGMEYSYSGCTDPRNKARSYDVNLNEDGTVNDDPDAIFPQLYYATGTDGINFACERFLEKVEWYDAYKCCVDASAKFLCIEYINTDGDRLHKFCDKDEDCVIDIGYTVTDTKSKNEIISSMNNTEQKNCTNALSNRYDELCNDIGGDDCSKYKAQCCFLATGSGDEKKTEKENIKECIDNMSKNSDSLSSEVTAELSESFFERLYGDQVLLEISESGEQANKYCFNTKTFCPYDFNVYGGSEQVGTEFESDHEYEYNNDTGEYEYTLLKDDDCINNNDEILSCNGRPSNFCQLDRHCMMLRPYPDIEVTVPNYPYIDKSCINNVGSSHNFPDYESYTSYSRMFNLKTHLTLPIVECIVETSKNLLFNRAGFTVCSNTDLEPDDSEYCVGGYKFKKGEDVSKYGYSNFIEKIRGRLSKLVKILLTLALIFYGFNFVVFGKAFNKEEFIKFLTKVIFVILFSLNTSWMNVLFNSVFQISGAVINITYTILQVDRSEPSYNNDKFDGCFFGEVTNKDDKAVVNNFDLYPSDRKYLAFFDYIDCKFQKYMGFDAGSMDIIAIMVLFLFTGLLTMVLLIPLLMIFLILLSVIIKITYIFIVAMLTLTLLLFFAPIIIPMILFDKTKKIFDGWVDQIIGFIFYPVFLIISVTLLFYIYDKFFISEAFYTGENGPYRNIVCGQVCKLSSTQYKPIGESNTAQNCEEGGGTVIDLTQYPICLYRATSKMATKDIGFLSFFTSLQFPILKISTTMFRFLFVNYAILFIILLFIETTLDNIIDISKVIFGVDVDREGVKNVSFVNIMSKIFGVALNISSSAMNTGSALYHKFRMRENKEDKGEDSQESSGENETNRTDHQKPEIELDSK